MPVPPVRTTTPFAVCSVLFDIVAWGDSSRLPCSGCGGSVNEVQVLMMSPFVLHDMSSVCGAAVLCIGLPGNHYMMDAARELRAKQRDEEYRKHKARKLARDPKSALSSEDRATIIGLVNSGLPIEEALNLFDNLRPDEAPSAVKGYLEDRQKAEAATAGPGAAGVFINLNQQQIMAALLQHYAQHYDREAGQRLLKMLSLHGANTPIPDHSNARLLGEHFRLLGYRSVIKALVKALEAMENALRVNTADTYRRMQHILQLAGPPGLGKTTAAIVLWAVLHYACCCNSSSNGRLEKLFPADSPDWELMRARIMSSMSPSKLLVFYLDFAERDLGKLQPLEADLEWQQILALRLLYGVLSPQLQRNGYADFLESMDGPLLQNLMPCHVAAFVREQAGFCPSEKLMMIWVFDEVQAFATSLQPTDSAPQMAHLLSAFVDFRVQCFVDKSPTLPVCVTATTLWSSTSLLQTRLSYRYARSTDLQLFPLADAHCKRIFNDVCERTKQWQQQQGQQQGPRGPKGQQQQMSDRATGVICEQTQWPAFDLQPSANMDDADEQLPEATMDMLRLAGGIPRLLSLALAAMAGGPTDTRIRADMLLPWQSHPPNDFHAARKFLLTSAQSDPSWQALHQQPGIRQLLEIAFAYDVYQEPVSRTGVVNLPAQCSDSSGSSSTGASQITWERGEQLGLWLLMTVDGRRQWLSEGGNDPDQSDDGDVCGQHLCFVRVVPLAMAAFSPTRSLPSVCLSL